MVVTLLNTDQSQKTDDTCSLVLFMAKSKNHVDIRQLAERILTKKYGGSMADWKTIKINLLLGIFTILGLICALASGNDRMQLSKNQQFWAGLGIITAFIGFGYLCYTICTDSEELPLKNEPELLKPPRPISVTNIYYPPRTPPDWR